MGKRAHPTPSFDDVGDAMVETGEEQLEARQDTRFDNRVRRDVTQAGHGMADAVAGAIQS